MSLTGKSIKIKFKGSDSMECLNCKKDLQVKEIENNMRIICDECGCIMKYFICKNRIKN